MSEPIKIRGKDWNPPPATRKRNPQLFPPPPIMDEDDAHAPKRVKQRSKPPSKLELEWGERLKLGSWTHIRNNSIALRLANGCVYWPDWTAMLAGAQYAWEVKGKQFWDDAVVKLKVAATQYPEIHFTLVWKEGDEWKVQGILP